MKQLELKLEKKKYRSHWYRYWHGECPVCGRDASYKERIYEDTVPFPPQRELRHRWIPDSQTYCGCDP